LGKYYITTSIPYINDKPHIGFAMELIYADVLARYERQLGNEVIFSTGTDEHGGKIAEKAKDQGIDVKLYCDEVSAKFNQLSKALNISNNRFIRTTDQGHEERVGAIWKQLSKDIYKGHYVGWYCTGDEAFFNQTEVDANNGVCPAHNRPYEKVEEDNYFFRLSKYTNLIKQAIKSNDFLVLPKTRRNEILALLERGLDDISISRPKDKINWGIGVPGDNTQVIYVWFEALMNYITVLGYPEYSDFKKFWPANVQVIGKDILRFHAAIWPAILLSLNIPLPKVLYAHGFVTADGKKMSKSLGNVIDPFVVIEKYGVDPFRYYMLRHIPSSSDGDFGWQKFSDSYNNELANELGNLVQRTIAMTIKYFDGKLNSIPPSEHDTSAFREALGNCQFDRALDVVWEQVKALNQYIDEERPWDIAKTGDKVYLEEVIAYMISSVREIAELLLPFLPSSAERIISALGSETITPIKGTLFPKFEEFNEASR